jgi:hypothetical protein
VTAEACRPPAVVGGTARGLETNTRFLGPAVDHRSPKGNRPYRELIARRQGPPTDRRLARLYSLERPSPAYRQQPTRSLFVPKFLRLARKSRIVRARKPRSLAIADQAVANILGDGARSRSLGSPSPPAEPVTMRMTSFSSTRIRAVGAHHKGLVYGAFVAAIERPRQSRNLVQSSV